MHWQSPPLQACNVLLALTCFDCASAPCQTCCLFDPCLDPSHYDSTALYPSLCLSPCLCLCRALARDLLCSAHHWLMRLAPTPVCPCCRVCLMCLVRQTGQRLSEGRQSLPSARHAWQQPCEYRYDIRDIQTDHTASGMAGISLQGEQSTSCIRNAAMPGIGWATERYIQMQRNDAQFVFCSTRTFVPPHYGPSPAPQALPQGAHMPTQPAVCANNTT